MFSLARALFSPGSAEDRSSLFVWFIDSMARSDSSRACASTVWLCAFADRPPSLAGRGAPEVSRFSCMLTIDEPDEQRRAIFGGAWGEKGAGQGEHRSTQHQPDTVRGLSVPRIERCTSSSIARILQGGSRMR